MKLLSRKKDTFDYNQQQTCITCNNSFQGKYCNKCGEKVLEPGEKSFIEFLSGLLNAFTFLEGKFWRTLKLILLSPGLFSKKFSEGSRQPYMKPVSIFFVANFIFFLFPMITSNLYNLPLSYQGKMDVYGSIAETMIQNKMVEENISFQQLEERYNIESGAWAKMLIVALVFLFALPLAVINYSRSKYFADHLYFSFEFNTFFLFVNMIFLSALISVLGIIAYWFNASLSFINDKFFTIFFAITIAYFLYRSVKTFYGGKWWVIIIKTTVLLAAVSIVIDCYRALLFFVTMQTI